MSDAQLHLGLFYTGVGGQYLWQEAGDFDHTTIDAYLSVAKTLERGLFDAFFLGEGLRVRENRGRILETDVAGRPDAITQLAALAGATEHIGLVATQNATYNFPADLARRLATLDVLSGGRAGWNVVTTDNAWTGANFRRGGWLPHERRYERAEQFVSAAKEIWAAERTVERHTDLVELSVTPTVPRTRPVVLQAGDSPGGRDLAARHADAVFSGNTEYPKALAYATDLRSRLAGYGRSPDSLRILPGASVVLGATDAEAQERAEWLRRELLTPRRAIGFLEQYWDKDLSAYDPDGPLPDVEPSSAELDPSRGTLTISDRTGKLDRIRQWRELAAEKNLSIRELVLQVQPTRHDFIGTPSRIADEWAHYVRTRAVDGFILGADRLPTGVEEIVDRLIPELQERGVYRTSYTGSTLREHLDLPTVD
ncbi:LLM class flavin-dependent oxidoreductase [Actinokineospora auranticolor]|uniref:Alkanesulfonate monooxygenase SsuD/methylene tetrahydromethanopterin reductase-like flavin-dependent oxidoreductase (Luciferase family) n=1 Tax=Actinokineospora auranticolor TaxID=155976 RepID=A0A2S6GF93_9PSEU|nr:LLM class flavin-dependent oxidoreductase [Actinokineospora auranticolor]PPK63883.1 alkanesulfonate monooxygenase SsuD/methylene tetrahydromethanopterin reductase-like flavin-dependent oxidoreductase (luciferase family) [Actinokineospora auranticolor]